MECSTTNQNVFFELLRAGLWEKDAWLAQFNSFDYSAVYKIAQEQSVVGLIAAGLEHVIDVKVPKEIALLFAGEALQLEQRNTSMNSFIRELMEKLRKENIHSVLVKGQGIAQCYERPLWRACGDVDLLLDEANYHKAKSYFNRVGIVTEIEDPKRLHVAYSVDGWAVEPHGSLRIALGKKIDNVIDEVQIDTLCNSGTRIWKNGHIDVLLPQSDDDIIYVFTHILQHFFRGGIGLRQICDLCRLLWMFRSVIDEDLLEEHLRKMGLKSEWKAFMALAVEWLGMDSYSIPLYSPMDKWKRKAIRIVSMVIETGNFGQNRDVGYRSKNSYLVMKTISLWRHTKDAYRKFYIFPIDTTRAWGIMLKVGIGTVLKDNL